MFGSVFGRKKAEHSAVVKVLPDELWQGEIGQALRDAGMSPDDASNLVHFDNPVGARVAQARVSLKLQVDAENKRIGIQNAGCSMAPMYIFTDDVWNGPHCELLLYRLELTPHDEWNVRILPSDEHSSKILGQPRAYMGQIDFIVDAVNRYLSELEAEHRASHDFKSAMTRDIWGLANALYVEHIFPQL